MEVIVFPEPIRASRLIFDLLRKPAIFISEIVRFFEVKGHRPSFRESDLL